MQNAKTKTSMLTYSRYILC